MGKVVASASMSLDGYIAKKDNTIAGCSTGTRTGRWRSHRDGGHHVSPEPAERRVLGPGSRDSARWSAGGRCSMSPTGGAGGTTWTCRSSSSRTRCPRAGSRPIPTHRSISSPTGLSSGGEGSGGRRGPHRRGHRGHGGPAMPGTRAARRGRGGPGAGGDGTGRPYFGELPLEDIPLGDPAVCVQGDRVTHLVFPASTPTTDQAARPRRHRRFRSTASPRCRHWTCLRFNPASAAGHRGRGSARH